MKTICPPKLKKGDEIRVIAPANSLALISGPIREIATKRLKKLGFTVTFGKNVLECDEFISSSVKSRVEDLHDAFRDKNVKAVLPVIGGTNSNEMLDYIDFNLIKKNPKIFCGYSDITALQNAIYSRTGLVTYSSPAFSTFGMKKGFEYIEEYFKKCLIQEKPIIIKPCDKFSGDAWYLDQDKRKYSKNSGIWVLNKGNAEGTIVGGNQCTFNLLHGTKYMPSLKNKILFIEDCVEDPDGFVNNFNRDLQSIIHQKGFNKVKAIVFGRAENSGKLTRKILEKIVYSKKELSKIPIIANVDFGHSYPMFTFPIGGIAKIDTSKKYPLEIVKH